MPDTINELLEMSQKTKELSNYIASLKRESGMMPDGPDKDNMIKEVKMRRTQVKFYIKKRENVSKKKP